MFWRAVYRPLRSLDRTSVRTEHGPGWRGGLHTARQKPRSQQALTCMYISHLPPTAQAYDIADVLWRHGEERSSRMVARALVTRTQHSFFTQVNTPLLNQTLPLLQPDIRVI